jgi:hypothetical protein
MACTLNFASKLYFPNQTLGASHKHPVALPFTLKSILRYLKKNYVNSNTSPYKNIIFKKNPLKGNQNPSRYYNSLTNLNFQHKPKCIIFQTILR